MQQKVEKMLKSLQKQVENSKIVGQIVIFGVTGPLEEQLYNVVRWKIHF